MTAMGLVKILGHALTAMTTAGEVASVGVSTHAALGVMINEGRDPTDAELDDMFKKV